MSLRHEPCLAASTRNAASANHPPLSPAHNAAVGGRFLRVQLSARTAELVACGSRCYGMADSFGGSV